MQRSVAGSRVLEPADITEGAWLRTGGTLGDERGLLLPAREAGTKQLGGFFLFVCWSSVQVTSMSLRKQL